MKKILFFLAAATAMLVGCSKSELDVENTPAPVAAENSFIGTFAMNEGTKTTVGDYGNQYLVFWESSDSIEVSCDGVHFYTFSIESLSEGNSQAIFTAFDPVPDGFFDQKSYTAKFGTVSYNCTQDGEKNVKHLPMSATTGTSRAFSFNVSVPVMAVKFPTGVSAKGVKVDKWLDTKSVTTVSTVTSSTALSAFYVPVPANATAALYDIYAFYNENCEGVLGNAMMMEESVTMETGSIYPFTYAPTLEITEDNHEWNLPDYAGDVRVKIRGPYDNVTIKYYGELHPANIYVDAKGYNVTNLTINAPDSHVEIVNGSTSNLTSETSTNSLVIKPSFRINTKLTLNAGSVYVEGTNGAANVAQIEIPSDVKGVVNISINTVSTGEPVVIVNNADASQVKVIGTVDQDYTVQSGSVTPVTVVAKIGNTSYSTLEAALTAAKTGETVTLSADAALDNQFAISDKDITLDLAGYKVTCAKTVGGGILAVHNGAGLTVNDSNGDGAVKGGSSAAGISVTVAGDNAGQPACLTINGGTIEGYYYGIAGNGNRQNTEITITGGTIKGTATDDSEGIYHPQNGTLIISGGTIEGYSGIYMKSGAVTALTGGTIKGTGAKKAYEYDPNGCSATGDAIIIDNCSYPGGAPSVTISGAALESTNAFQIGAYYGNGKTAISDIYSTDNTLTAANDCVWKETEVAGTYKLAVADPVAKIGDKTYTSLEAAVAAVPTDGTKTTITMVADATVEPAKADQTGYGVNIAVTQNVVLDLAGYTISGTSTTGAGKNYSMIQNNGTLEIKDSGNGGKISYKYLGESPHYGWSTNAVTNTVTGSGSGDATLTVTSGIIENNTEVEENIAYAIDNLTNTGAQKATLNITNGTFIAPNCDAVIRMFLNSKTGANTVTIDDGTFEGFVFYVQNPVTGDGAQLGTLTINGGTYTCNSSGKWFDLGCSQATNFSKVKVNINGGKFTGMMKIRTNVPDSGKDVVVVSGGYFNTNALYDRTETLADYAAFGYEVAANTEESTKTAYPWTVKKAFVQESDGKYHIYSLAGLKMFRDAANSAAITFGSKTIVIDNTVQTIDLKNEEWVPINSSWNPGFTFDGNGCVIKNLKVDKCENPSSGKDPKKYAGLFGNAGCSTIQNLTVDGANVKGIGYVAAIAGHGLCAKLINCTVKDAIITSVVDNDDDGDKAGAICGYLTGQQVAYAKNCYAENCTITAYRDLGGMVGFAQNAEVSNSTIKNVTVVVDNSNDYNSLGDTSTEAHNARLWSGRLSDTTLTGNTEEGTNTVKFK